MSNQPLTPEDALKFPAASPPGRSWNGADACWKLRLEALISSQPGKLWNWGVVTWAELLLAKLLAGSRAVSKICAWEKGL